MYEYAAALHLSPIVPGSVEDEEECEQCADRYIEARDKLCAYLLSAYPRALKSLENSAVVLKMLRSAESEILYGHS